MQIVTETRTPTAQDALLLIEVADKTLTYDRTVKASLYASAGVPTLWVIDVSAGELHRFSEPGTAGYRQRMVLRRGDRVPLPAPVSATLGLSSIL